jgi:ABC-type lipoprotein export system ATPase subunit
MRRAQSRDSEDTSGAPGLNKTTNIAASLPPLIGQETALSQGLAELLKTRLLTLTGPGGSGKTSLAEHMAHTLAYGSSKREGHDVDGDHISTSRTDFRDARRSWLDAATHLIYPIGCFQPSCTPRILPHRL